MTPSLPYARPYWTEEEIAAVTDVVRSGFWTAGQSVGRFERALAEATRAPEVVCVSSGTAAIHALLYLLGGSARRRLFVTSALNFVGGPAAAVHAGYDIALTDIDPGTLNMSAASLRDTLRSRAGGYDLIVVMPVHLAGNPVDMTGIVATCRDFDATLVEDACHALGAHYIEDGSPVGSHPDSDGAVFSFHPTKPVAAGEGGAVAVRDPALADRLRLFRNHNMDKSVAAPGATGPVQPWHYEVASAGLNLRMSEFNAAIGLVQLRRLGESLDHRRHLAQRYRRHLGDLPCLRYLPAADEGTSALHLFPVSFDLDTLGLSRAEVFARYSRYGVTPQVHYIPLFEQPAFADHADPGGGRYAGITWICPGLVSLPLFMGMSEADQDRVIAATRELLGG